MNIGCRLALLILHLSSSMRNILQYSHEPVRKSVCVEKKMLLLMSAHLST